MSSSPQHFDETAANIEVREGSTFVIELSAMPTAGYVWKVTRCPAIVKLEADDIHPSSEQMGAGATQQLRFRAIGKGTAPLTLTYGHPWEESGEQTLKPTVIVK